MTFNLFLNIENLPILFMLYIFSAAIVVTVSVRLSKYTDALDKKTRLSGAFIGGVILAAVTSLPELFTSAAAVCMLNQPELVNGNVYGSNIFNLTIIAICSLISLKSFQKAEISKAHAKALIFAIIMSALSLAGTYIPEKYLISAAPAKINAVSILIAALYVIHLKTAKGGSSPAADKKDVLPPALRQIIMRFAFLSVILVAVSILLTQITDSLSEKLSLGKTVAGAVFLGAATSLPELTSSISLARLKNYNASIGNITGSNIFNFTILCLSDILYKKGNIYNPRGGMDFADITSLNADSLIIALFAAVSSFLAILILKFRKNTFISALLALAIISSYILSIAFPMLAAG